MLVIKGTYFVLIFLHLFFCEHPVWRFANVDFIHCIVGKNLTRKMMRMVMRMTMLMMMMLVLMTMLMMKMMMLIVTLVVAAAVAACFLVGKDAKILSKVTWGGGKVKVTWVT